jgi:hypothetical protein
VTADDSDDARDLGGPPLRPRPRPSLGGVSVVRGSRVVATGTVRLLGAIFTYAIRKKFRADNLVRGIMRFADGRRERRLTDLEYRAVGNVLENAAFDDIRQEVIAATITSVQASSGFRRPGLSR